MTLRHLLLLAAYLITHRGSSVSSYQRSRWVIFIYGLFLGFRGRSSVRKAPTVNRDLIVRIINVLMSAFASAPRSRSSATYFDITYGFLASGWFAADLGTRNISSKSSKDVIIDRHIERFKISSHCQTNSVFFPFVFSLFLGLLRCNRNVVKVFFLLLRIVRLQEGQFVFVDIIEHVFIV